MPRYALCNVLQLVRIDAEAKQQQMSLENEKNEYSEGRKKALFMLTHSSRTTLFSLSVSKAFVEMTD